MTDNKEDEKEFTILCEEVRTFEVKVKGINLEDAIRKIESEPSVYIGDERGEYLDGSFNVNKECTYEANKDKE